jgi:hypothetical protein
MVRHACVDVSAVLFNFLPVYVRAHSQHRCWEHNLRSPISDIASSFILLKPMVSRPNNFHGHLLAVLYDFGFWNYSRFARVGDI